jgi:hypothetical protein
MSDPDPASCPLCNDTGWMTPAGRVIQCTCPAGNAAYWQERARSAQAAQEHRGVKDEDESEESDAIL